MSAHRDVAAHCTMDSMTGDLVCKHCGEHKPVQRPVDVMVLANEYAAFRAEHATCPEPAPE